MEIRSDFHSIEDLLQRALVYAEQFREFSFENWAHLKHKEDFRLIYDLPESQRYPLVDVYSYGRNLANQLSELLSSFNYPGDFPTFRSFVDEIEKVLEPAKSKAGEVISKAEVVLPHLQYHVWSIEQMIELYRKQLNLILALQDWVRLAKTKRLYIDESGISDRVKTKVSLPLYRRLRSLSWFKNHPKVSLIIVILSGVVGVITWLGNFTGALQNISSFWGQSENSKTAQMPIARLPFDIQMQTAKARIRYLSQEYLHTDTLSLVEIIGHYGDNQLDSPELYDWDKVMMELEKQEFIKILKKENGNIVFKVVKTK